ncbi:MAG: SpoIIE family protein phosphatase [Acidobacteriota bacterium]|jgi:sigma-B regulation protein RsbU (phosphoserine phosphatase)
MEPAGDGRLLVVDDDELNRDMLSRRLERRGYAVATAADGCTALDRLEAEAYDLVVLDIMMPGMDGIEVLSRIREGRSPSELPVIMATAKDSSEEVVRALEAGANDYVTKPLDFPVVVARVQTHLRLKQAREELSRAHSRMKRDLEAAARLQRALIPRTMPAVQGVRFTWEFQPCDELAGDILDVYRVDDRTAGLYLLDVSGHGVPAALLSVTLSRLLSGLGEGSYLLEGGPAGAAACPCPPAEVAGRLNRQFPMDLETMQYFTFLYGVLDVAAGEFRFASAAHPGPIHVPAVGAPTAHQPTGPAIGWFPEASYEEAVLPVAAGDRVYLVSDGLLEAEDPGGAFFGQERLIATLREARDRSLEESAGRLMRAIRDWCGPPGPGDDLSVLAFEITPGG